jgi:hypothetical protein
MLHARNKIKRSIIRNSLIACFLLPSLLAGCNDTRPRIYNKSKALIILKNAEGTFYDLRDGGSIQLSYKLIADYPASSVLTEISTQLEGAGWHPLKEDFLNPGQPSSHVRGWSNFEDASRAPTKIGYSWMGSWEDKYRNIVTYIFIYQYPKNKKRNLSVLQIHEIYEPASLVDLTKQEIKKHEVKP